MDRRGFLKTVLATSAATGSLGAIAGAHFATDETGAATEARSALSRLSLGVISNETPTPPALLARAADLFHHALAAHDGNLPTAPRWAPASEQPDILIAGGHYGADQRPELAIFGGVPLFGGQATAAHVAAWLEQSGATDLWRELGADLGWVPIPIATFDGGGIVARHRERQTVSPDEPLPDVTAAAGLNRQVVADVAKGGRRSVSSDITAATALPGNLIGLSPQTMLRLFVRDLTGSANKAPTILAQYAIEALTFTAPIVAAYISNAVWSALDASERRLLQLAGKATVLAHMAEQTAFEATIVPAWRATGDIEIIQADAQTEADEFIRAAETIIGPIETSREMATLYATLTTMTGATAPKPPHHAFPTA